jgi:hypothetical protein
MSDFGEVVAYVNLFFHYFRVFNYSTQETRCLLFLVKSKAKRRFWLCELMVLLGVFMVGDFNQVHIRVTKVHR